MAESKNSFIQSKMNKDLDERLIPNNVYRDALNIAVSRSEGSDVGALESVLGNSVVSTGNTGTVIIGSLVDESNSFIYFFKTNYTGLNDIIAGAVPLVNYEMTIERLNVGSGQTQVLVSGNFLNFSTQSYIYGINLIENLLFWTDNRNAPRKINIDSAFNNALYYTTADQMSVCKWAPYLAPEFIDLNSVITPLNPTHPSTMSDAVDLPTVLIGTSKVTSSNLNVTRYRNGDKLVETTNLTDWIAADTSGIGAYCYYDNSFGNEVSYGILYNKHAVEDSRNLAPIGYKLPNETEWTAIIAEATGTELKAQGFDYWKEQLTEVTAGTLYVNGINDVTSGGAGSGMKVQITVNDVGAILTATIYSLGNNLYVANDVINIDQSIGSVGSGGQFTFTGSIEGTNTLGFNARGSGERKGLTLLDDFNGLKELTTFWIGASVATPPVETDKFVKITYDGVNATIENALAVDPKKAGRSVRLIRENDYDGWQGDPEYLKDKFAKFSYRFKFDDNEYSLVAPFSQDVFIPEQEGKFVNNNENEAFISTVVEFMQNSINNAVLNITLPTTDIFNEYKIRAIDILVKESDAQLYSVIETVVIDSNFADTLNGTNIYQYDYESLLPVRTLTISQTTRVYDKVPIRALAQESSGNRVMYGNFAQKYGAPIGLDYYVQNIEKSVQDFIEYPQHSLKQNRNYQIGLILADKYGRETDVILSNYDNQLGSDGKPKLGSNLFVDYKGLQFVNTIDTWRGDNLQLQFDTEVPENPNAPNTTTEYPGAYAVGNYYEVPFANITGKYFWDLSNQTILSVALDTQFTFFGLPYDQIIAANTYGLYKNEGDGWILVPVAEYTLTEFNASPRVTLNVATKANINYKYQILYTALKLNKYKTGQEDAAQEDLFPNFPTAYPDYFSMGKELRGLYCDYIKITAVYPVESPIRAVEIYTTKEVASTYLFNNTTVTRPEITLTAVTTPKTFATYNINPKGYYSYRIGVKQQQQDYYNVYLPGIINGYPISGDILEQNETSFTTLISDNINKIPRNLQDVGPLQNQFTSDQTLYGRVVNTTQVAVGTGKAYNKQFYPASSPDKTDLVGTIKDLYPDFTVLDYNVPPLPAAAGKINSFTIYDPETRPYVAKFSTQRGIGVTEDNYTQPSSLTNEPYPSGMSLAVYETSPLTVPFELFYEATTSGLISDLNNDIKGANTAINGMTTPTVSFEENDPIGKAITGAISPTINGSIYNGSTGALASIYNFNDLGQLNTNDNLIGGGSPRFTAGSNDANQSIFIQTADTFYAGSDGVSVDLGLGRGYAGRFIYTINWTDATTGLVFPQSGEFNLANNAAIISESGAQPNPAVSDEWIFGNTGTISGITSPSGTNGSARPSGSSTNGNNCIFLVGAGAANQCWSITQLTITDAAGAASVIAPASISDFFSIELSDLTAGDASGNNKTCGFNLKVNKALNPLASGYGYNLTCRLVDTSGEGSNVTVQWQMQANTYTLVHSNTYTSGTGATYPSTIPSLSGNSIEPMPSWAGQIQNWTNQTVYLYVKLVTGSTTDSPFVAVVDSVNSIGSTGEFPDGTSTGLPSSAQPSIGVGGPTTVYGVTGISLEPFLSSPILAGQRSILIANGVRPGQSGVYEFPDTTTLAYDELKSALVNIRMTIGGNPYSSSIGQGSFDAQLVWSYLNSLPVQNPENDIESLSNGSSNNIPPFYPNSTTLSLTTAGSGYGTSSNPYDVTNVSGSMTGSGMKIVITNNGTPGAVVTGVIKVEGTGYAAGDIISITDTPNGTGATFTIVAPLTTSSVIAPTYVPIPNGPNE